jgi:phosphoribosylanthranilate isomerase
VIVQIYSLTHPEDVAACARAGVDHFGVAGGGQPLPAAVSAARTRDLFAAVPDDRTSVALSAHADADAALDYARAVRPDVLHACADRTALPRAATAELTDRLPTGVDLMRSVDVAGPDAVDVARDLDPVVDWLLLDTAAADVPGIGASGATHDWSVSRAVVDAVDVPVVLAGGLTPDNVAGAVREAGPAGVDSYTGTSLSERRKDRDAVDAFVRNARAAAGGGD